MQGTYAAIWSHADKPITVGNVQLENERIRLVGGSHRDMDHQIVPIDHIAAVRLAHSSERLRDLKTVVIDLVAGSQVKIATLGLGAAFELAALLSETLRAG